MITINPPRPDSGRREENNLHFYFHTSLCIVDTPSLSAGGGGVEPPTKSSKSGGVTGPQLLEGGCREKGGILVSNKNKLKSEIFNDKKSL